MCVPLTKQRERTKANKIKVVCVTQKSLYTADHEIVVDIKHRNEKRSSQEFPMIVLENTEEGKKLLAKEFFNNLYLRVKLVFIIFLLVSLPFKNGEGKEEEEGEKNAMRPSKVFSKRVGEELCKAYQFVFAVARDGQRLRPNPALRQLIN